MFYNTGIATYVWILSNKKVRERKNKVQLINAVHLYQKMRKSLGSKRQELGEDDIALITRTFGKFKQVKSYDLDKAPKEKSTRGRPSSKKAERRTFACKIFATHEFGYRRITVERPLRLSVQFTDERLAELRFASGRLIAVMRRVYESFGQDWDDKTYGQLSQVREEVRALVKADFQELKEKQVKELLDPETWTAQKELLGNAVALQAAIGTEQHDDYNVFQGTLKAAMKKTGVRLDAKSKKQLLAAVSWTNPDAEPVVKEVVDAEPYPMCKKGENRCL